jgi:rare lipoprotein A
MNRLRHRPVAAGLGLGLAGGVLAMLVACVGVDPSRPLGGAALDPARALGAVAAPRFDTDDDRLTAALTAGEPGVRPRVEPLRRGAPNLPYEIGDERYVPTAQDLPMRQSGIASWYGEPFHGRLTATGERYDMHALTAAHPTMPLPSYALVRHVASGRQVIVRVNDRGPFVGGRVIDLSRAAAQRLGIEGIARVEVVRLTHDDIRQGRWTDPAVRLASADLVPRP